MSAPRRRMYGPGAALRPTTTGDELFTGPTFSDDEIDAMYGLPAADPCTCFRDGEYFPESCNRADHRATAQSSGDKEAGAA